MLDKKRPIFRWSYFNEIFQDPSQHYIHPNHLNRRNLDPALLVNTKSKFFKYLNKTTQLEVLKSKKERVKQLLKLKLKSGNPKKFIIIFF